MNAIDLQYHRKFQDALGSGDMFALFERTREAIAKFPDDPEVRYLQALAMARLGDPHAAMRLYERNRVEEIGSEDAIALKGRLLKDLAVRRGGRSRSTCSASRARPIVRHTGCLTAIFPASMQRRPRSWRAMRMTPASLPPLSRGARRRRPAGLFCCSIGGRGNAGVRRGRTGDGLVRRSAPPARRIPREWSPRPPGRWR